MHTKSETGGCSMAHGYDKGEKYRGGQQDRSKTNDGPGKNAKHGDGGQHSQKAKSNGSKSGGQGN